MKASVGVAIMAKNAAETLGACLDSLRPYVMEILVGVDVTTTDKTKMVARKHGAKTFPLVVAEEHTCPKHGTIQVQHFGKARQKTFEKLNPNLDFWLWIDSDDILKGGEHLAELCSKLKGSPAVGAWMPYRYSTFNDGKNTNTLFDRERLCRVKGLDGTPIVWEWQHRVHEVIAPKNVSNPQWFMQKEIEVIHQEGRHNSANSSGRNQALLEIDLEENPGDIRAMFYLANGYFAMGNMPGAIYWYDQVCRRGKNHYEIWQSFCYSSISYGRMGNYDMAAQQAYGAMNVEPRYPEPYLQLAWIAASVGEHEKALYWSEQAKGKEEPPFFVFKNPLDYTYSSHIPVADSLAALGRIPEARAELEAAYAVMPTEKIGEAIEHYKDLERGQQIANAFLLLNQDRPDDEVIDTYEAMGFPPNVMQFGRIRDRVMPAYLRRRSSSQRRIVFWCGRSLEEWSPLSLTTTGIGGSETAVVEIAERFARDDWRVDVYNGAGRYEGVYDDGVGYWEPERLGPGESADIFVSWRQPKVPPSMKIGRQNVLWCHDLNYGPDEPGWFHTWDKVLGVSAWHSRMLSRYYDVEASFVPNGVNLSRFDNTVHKEAFRCVYGSSPDRGLDRLLTLWPQVLKREPGATLHLAYGWDNIDKLIDRGQRAYVTSQGSKGDLALLKDRCQKMIKALGDNVVDHGRLPQDKLAELYSSSTVWVYPTSFLEVSCITAMEAMAAGAVPVVSKVGALPETIGGGGILVDGMPESRVYNDFYANILIGTMTHPNLYKPLEIIARRRATELTWDHAYARWKDVLGIESQNGVVKEGPWKLVEEEAVSIS